MTGPHRVASTGSRSWVIGGGGRGRALADGVISVVAADASMWLLGRVRVGDVPIATRCPCRPRARSAGVAQALPGHSIAGPEALDAPRFEARGGAIQGGGANSPPSWLAGWMSSSVTPCLVRACTTRALATHSSVETPA